LITETKNLPQNNNLSPPDRNFTLETYPNLQKMFGKISNCGKGGLEFYNETTNETKKVPAYCDNRVCRNPECQRHRLYKFQSEHINQINLLRKTNKNRTRAWIFTTPRKPYPIDKTYIVNQRKKLEKLINENLHPKYGTDKPHSIHMEIKPHKDSYYLHFHCAIPYMKNLRLIRKIWGYQIKQQEAISQEKLPYYISKYASKTPKFETKEAILEYAHATYKTQMHKFQTPRSPTLPKSKDYQLINAQFPKSTATFYELQLWFENYALGAG